MPRKQPDTRTFFEQEIDRIYNDIPFRPAQFAQVRQSKILMETHFAEAVDLDALASAACMSRFHYVRVFRQMYGVTPRHYLRDLRITKAKALIQAGIPITQVCGDVGYESLPTFSSVFKKCTGFSPKAYQQRHKSNLE